MDYKFTSEQEALRKEFGDFFSEIMKEAPPGWGGNLEDTYGSDEGWNFHKKVSSELVKRGWVVRAWPKEYGGQDAPLVEQLIFSDVAGYHFAPGIDLFGAGMIGPTLLSVGTDEQKKEHLLPIAKGERGWCQLWSEPNAGSDLASLTTAAKLEGDYYILNGQKTWTSGAHRADWGFGVFRTDPEKKRSKGLSFMVLDMKTKGVTINPILAMDGTHLFNEVFFDDVAVPTRNRVGKENKGWDVTRAAMNFERSNAGMISMTRRHLENLVDYCKKTKRGGKSLAENPLIRNKLAQIAIEIEVGRALGYQIVWIQEKKGLMGAAALASSAKVFGTEGLQNLAYTALEILGLPGLIRRDSDIAPLKGIFEMMYQFCPGANIFAGSNEIQRNIIAWMGLRQPRSWDEVFRRKTE